MKACMGGWCTRRDKCPIHTAESDEPPAEMNGSVMPVTGTSPTTTAMLMKAWRQIQPVIPAASSAPKVSGARIAVRTPA